MAVQALLTWLARGTFGDGKPEFSWSLQVNASAGSCVHTLIKYVVRVTPPPTPRKTPHYSLRISMQDMLKAAAH